MTTAPYAVHRVDAPVVTAEAWHQWLDAIKAEASMDRGVDLEAGIDPVTRRYWKANAGNAKARRRWRRMNLRNSHKPRGAPTLLLCSAEDGK